MTLTIKYIATVDAATGVIENVGTAPGADLPVEGVVDGKEIVWIPSEGWEGKNNLTIHEEYFRKNGEWVHRGPPPTRYYIWDTETESWVFNPEDFWEAIRVERNQKIFRTDWTQMSDAPLTASQKTIWAVYRQALRDVPAANAEATRVEDIVWPTPPE